MNFSALALNRFGLGARPDERVRQAPQRWLPGQIEAYDPLPQAPENLGRAAAGFLARADGPRIAIIETGG